LTYLPMKNFCGGFPLKEDTLLQSWFQIFAVSLAPQKPSPRYHRLRRNYLQGVIDIAVIISIGALTPQKLFYFCFSGHRGDELCGVIDAEIHCLSNISANTKLHSKGL
jgi:hypothetical protein